MSKVKGVSNASNVPNWEELRRYTSASINAIVEQVNGRLSFQDNLATAGPYTLSFTDTTKALSQAHNLGIQPQGILVVKQNAPMVLYAPSENPWTSSQVFLKSSVVGTVTFYLI